MGPGSEGDGGGSVGGSIPGADPRTELRRRVAATMDQAWVEPGFCVPNLDVYPHQWLWDSCFHAVIWAHLGSDRGVTEVANALSAQADDGFVPHMIYWHQPELHADFWGRPGSSVISQPPMYGHALAELQRRRCVVPDDLVAKARAGLLHLGRRARTSSGLVPILHPWESGCDDSPRWDRWFPPGLEKADRQKRKGDLVDSLVRSREGHGLDSAAFAVGSIGFNALVAWNARELVDTFDQPDDALTRLADELTESVASRWQQDRWVDEVLAADAAGPEEPGIGSAGVRTVDTLTALLVDPRPEAFDQLVDPEGFGAPFGPRGVHRVEPAYQPDVYWRGAAWPQLTYLLMVAASRAGRPGTCRLVARWLVDGAERSGLAEY
ncbi:MAG: hypothetical protein AAFO29_12425, partial [Actinomycetota bacterium]